MSLKKLEKATSADRTEQHAIIKICVDLGKTMIETKQIIEEPNQKYIEIF